MTDASGAAALVARDWNRFILNVHERLHVGALEHPVIVIPGRFLKDDLSIADQDNGRAQTTTGRQK
jgi:hypothetical protein